MVEIALGGRAAQFEPRKQQKKTEDLFKSSASSVIRLGLEGADAPSRAPCLHPPTPLGKGALLGSSLTTTHTNNKAEDLFKSSASSVIRLGLEPRTPALKVLCSTS